MGVLLILAKTIAQALTTPELVTDSEEPLGTTVCMQYLFFQCFEIQILANFVSSSNSSPYPTLNLVTYIIITTTVLTIVSCNSFS